MAIHRPPEPPAGGGSGRFAECCSQEAGLTSSRGGRGAQAGGAALRAGRKRPRCVPSTRVWLQREMDHEGPSLPTMLPARGAVLGADGDPPPGAPTPISMLITMERREFGEVYVRGWGKRKT